MSTKLTARIVSRSLRSSSRYHSTSSPSQAQHAPITPSSPSPSSSKAVSTETTTRIVSSILLSRAPLLLPPLTPLESTYYAYQRSIAHSLSQSTPTSTAWFLKSGSASEKNFIEQEGLMRLETGLEASSSGAEGGVAEVQGVGEQSLERKPSRTLYLMVKKDRTENSWQFPQGGVEGSESLLEAAQRELKEEVGTDIDVWSCGTVPAGAYEYAFPTAEKRKDGMESARVFFLPMRIIRGQVVPNNAEGLVDFAWLTKEEVHERVGGDENSYWTAVKHMLSTH